MKDTIIFVFGAGFLLFLNVDKIDNGKKYFVEKVKNYVTFIAIFAFIVNNYSFNFWIELLIRPIVLILVGMSVVAENQKQNQVKTFADVMIGIIVFLIVIFTIKGMLNSHKSISELINLNEFLLPILLTLLYFPLLYLFRLYAVYQSLFVYIKKSNKNS